MPKYVQLTHFYLDTDAMHSYCDWSVASANDISAVSPLADDGRSPLSLVRIF